MVTHYRQASRKGQICLKSEAVQFAFFRSRNKGSNQRMTVHRAQEDSIDHAIPEYQIAIEGSGSRTVNPPDSASHLTMALLWRGSRQCKAWATYRAIPTSCRRQSSGKMPSALDHGGFCKKICQTGLIPRAL